MDIRRGVIISGNQRIVGLNSSDDNLPARTRLECSGNLERGKWIVVAMQAPNG